MTNRRKHVSQMTAAEQDRIAQYVHSIRRWKGLDSRHVSERKAKWNLTNEEIIEALRKGNVIEAHANNSPDIRIVMRHTVGQRDVCVCASINQSIVTAWVNDTEDFHGTLNLTEYQWKANMVNVFGTARVK